MMRKRFSTYPAVLAIAVQKEMGFPRTIVERLLGF